MANVPIKTITFPGLTDTYTFLQDDTTLSVSGAAADAAVVGAALSASYNKFAVVPNNTDINSLTSTGGYFLNSSRNYPNAPWDSTKGGILLTFMSGNSSGVQIAYSDGAKKMLIRQYATTWRSWVDVNLHNTAYDPSGKYVAFGDSLMYGAVWSPTSGTAQHRVKAEWRIPARIAVALGRKENFVNEAVSGIGYVTQSGGVNLQGKIAAYDFTGVDVVTVFGGANDKLISTISLGDKDSTAGDGTICGAIKSIIASIRASNKKTLIYIIQPLPSGYTLVDGQRVPLAPWSGRGAGGWSLDDFDAEVKEICENLHVCYVNWNSCSYCNAWDTTNIGYNNTDGPNYTHPVADADYCILGDYIAGKIYAGG